MPLPTQDDLRTSSLLVPTVEATPAIPALQVPVVDVDHDVTFVDLKWTPRIQLLTHIEGASWVVDYFSQVITKDSALSGVELSTSAVFQNYIRISKLELRVSTALNTNQDDQTKTMRVSGSATILPVIIPNVGDMFTAFIGEGKIGVFRVTSTVKKSIFKESCYEIGYNLDTDATDKRDDLLAKTVLTHHYVKNNLLYGTNPLISTEAFDAGVQIQSKYYRVLQDWLRSYLSKEMMMLAVGGQEGVDTYDHFLSGFITGNFGTADNAVINKIITPGVSDEDLLTHPSIWDAVATRNEELLSTCFHRYCMANAYTFTSNPNLRGLRYSGMDMIIYPQDPRYTVDIQTHPILRMVDNAVLLGTLPAVNLPFVGDNSSLIHRIRGVNLSVLSNQTGPIIYPVTQDAYYVFSEHFYNQDAQMSVLEQMVLGFIRKERTDLVQLSEFLSLSTTWPDLERYYYTPLLLIMAKTALYMNQ